jgi:hypothetical protein
VRHLSFVVVLVVGIAGFPASPVAAQDVRTIAAIHAALLTEGIDALERQEGQVRETWVLVDAGAGAMVEALRQGEELDALRARDEHLQELESLLLMRIFDVQRVRREVLANRAIVEAADGLAASASDQVGVLTGNWTLTVQPGLKGTAYLVQQGTLVSGTYELSGGWTGSLRGTLVANKIRLERIDSQLGFAAIFYGELNTGVDPPVIQGRWEATQLATGMPSAGGWQAVRAD